jgi:hypothetical protein
MLADRRRRRRVQIVPLDCLMSGGEHRNMARTIIDIDDEKLGGSG